MAFIEVLDYEQSDGRLREIYDDLIKSRGKLADVHKIQSLNPESIVAHMDLYMKIMFGQSPLKRYQREMLAVVVSNANRCPYCIQHHAEALLHFWKDPQMVEQLKTDFEQLDITETDKALCRFATLLTTDPAKSNLDQLAKKLVEIGLSDRIVLDAGLVIAYFNFVNRLVLGLGVTLETEGAGGYVYE